METKIRRSYTLNISTMKLLERVCALAKEKDSVLYYGLLSNQSKFVDYVLRNALEDMEINLKNK